MHWQEGMTTLASPQTLVDETLQKMRRQTLRRAIDRRFSLSQDERAHLLALWTEDAWEPQARYLISSRDPDAEADRLVERYLDLYRRHSRR